MTEFCVRAAKAVALLLTEKWQFLRLVLARFSERKNVVHVAAEVDLSKLDEDMKNKNLAEEYLNKVADSAIYFKRGKFPDMPLFQEKDIKDAFNAGCASAVENIPELKWVECVGGYVAETNFNEWYIEVNELVKEKYTLVIANATPRCFTTLKNAKQSADEDYKKRIIQALGL